jgi:hypothetical protein
MSRSKKATQSADAKALGHLTEAGEDARQVEPAGEPPTVGPPTQLAPLVSGPIQVEDRKALARRLTDEAKALSQNRFPCSAP